MLDEQFLKGKIRDIKDYPKKGITFRDITPLIKDARAFSMCIDGLAAIASKKRIDYVVGVEARGFVVGSALAYKMKKGFVLVRKKGKLPRKTIGRDYELEYGSERLEMHDDAIEKGSRVLIADDLLATGGTARAVAELVELTGSEVAAIGFLVELADLKGREKLKGYDIISLIKY